MTVSTMTPAEAWERLSEGNDRFARDAMEHPAQDMTRRAEIAAHQHPFAVVLGCSDSRVAVEAIFDQGLGDVFVVRTAGNVLDPGVIGSVEYGVAVAGASLVVVLGHESCGAVKAAVATLRSGEAPSGFVRAVVDRVIPSIVGLDPSQTTDVEALTSQHVRHTVRTLAAESAALAQAISAGTCAVVGAHYAMTGDGRVRLDEVVGQV
jgi:carbonic anhydrase